jgi:uncharacterized LabA/DUF88 family protein
MYMNWPVSEDGNILYCDRKFVTRLYGWNDDEFTDLSKVSDVSTHTKQNIYNFIESSDKTVFVVDCENSDPYRLCATLNSLDPKYLRKITKLMLYHDENAASAWSILKTFVSPLLVELVPVKRISRSKSQVDITLAAGALSEHYKNNVDSFVIVSSDSDYWALINSMPDANFLVMVEHEKLGSAMKNAMFDAGIYYCYIDDFYSGNANNIKVEALKLQVQRYLNESIYLNVHHMMDEAYKSTRIEFPETERKQFFAKYISKMKVGFDGEGNLEVSLAGN